MVYWSRPCMCKSLLPAVGSGVHGLYGFVDGVCIAKLRILCAVTGDVCQYRRFNISSRPHAGGTVQTVDAKMVAMSSSGLLG